MAIIPEKKAFEEWWNREGSRLNADDAPEEVSKRTAWAIFLAGWRGGQGRNVDPKVGRFLSACGRPGMIYVATLRRELCFWSHELAQKEIGK